MKSDNFANAFQELPVPLKLATAGVAACFADFVSFPLDTAKVRLQVQGEVRIPTPLVVSHCLASTGSTLGFPYVTTGQYRGILGTLVTISKEEGFRSLYNGLNAGLQRQMCFAAVRLGMYEPVKKCYQRLLKVDPKQGGGVVDVLARVMGGMTTGGLAVLCAQPTDVVKVRFQCQVRSVSEGAPKLLTGTWQAYRAIFFKEGLLGLWKGTLPNAGRNAIVNVSEIVCYDLVKESIIRRGLLQDNIVCHFSSAVVAGFCATLCASPVDVIKTRYMNSAPGKYRGAFDCAVKTFLREGGSAFYKGFWPSFSRLVSWNIVMWITYEQLKQVAVQRYVSHGI